MPVPNQITPDPAVDRNFRSLQDQITALQNTRVNAGEPNLTVIRGRLSTTTPTILHGTGFTVVRNGVGDVTVTFTTAFTGVPAITATGDASETAIYPVPTTTTFRVVTLTSAGAALESTLNFIAIGPA